MNQSKIEERLPEPQLNQGTNDDVTSVSPSIAKPIVVRSFGVLMSNGNKITLVNIFDTFQQCEDNIYCLRYTVSALVEFYICTVNKKNIPQSIVSVNNIMISDIDNTISSESNIIEYKLSRKDKEQFKNNGL